MAEPQKIFLHVQRRRKKWLLRQEENRYTSRIDKEGPEKLHGVDSWVNEVPIAEFLHTHHLELHSHNLKLQRSYNVVLPDGRSRKLPKGVEWGVRMSATLNVIVLMPTDRAPFGAGASNFKRSFLEARTFVEMKFVSSGAFFLVFFHGQ